MEEPKKLICPECGGALKEVVAEASYGRVIVLDQCPSCGGVWFDKWELYFATDAAMKKLEAMDAGAFVAPVEARPVKGLCPRCEKELVAFTDPKFPKDLLMGRCHGCNGLWLNRGELGRFAGHRSAFRVEKAPYKSPETDALVRLQKELKLDSLFTPTTMELAANLPEERPVNGREVAKDLAFLALQSLMRLVFKF